MDSEHEAQVVHEARAAAERATLLSRFLREPVWAKDFNNLSYEWRRLFSELFGTFLLVLAGAGAGTVNSLTNNSLGLVAEVVSPALTVMAVILFMGTVSGAHLNPVITLAFALRTDFLWRRVPGYLIAQCVGSCLAILVLRWVFPDASNPGLLAPGAGFDARQAFLLEAVLTLGLVSVVLGTASTAQNIGALSAVGVAGYIAVAGLWASPVSGACMNPARAFGPALVEGEFSQLWIYLAGPLIGAVAAVGAAYILRGPGGGPGGSRAAQGTLNPPRVRRDRTG